MKLVVEAVTRTAAVKTLKANIKTSRVILNGVVVSRLTRRSYRVTRLVMGCKSGSLTIESKH